MATRWIVCAVLAAAVLGACDANVPPASPAANVAQVSLAPTASPSAAPTASPSPSPTATPTLTPSPTATPTPTPKPTPAPWKSYKSKRYHYRIKYPPTWVVTPGTTKLADQLDDFGDHFVYISRDVVSGTLSVSLTVTHDIGTFKSHYKARLISNSSISLAGYTGRLLVFWGKDDGRNVLIQHVIVGKGNTAYFLDMFTDRSHIAADKHLFRKILLTWRPT